MKKTKIIVPALAMLVMSTAATVTGTVAWFSMNKTVTASGMKVKATAEGSLVIKAKEATSATLPAATLKATDVNLESATTALYASTHTDDYSTYASGLKYVTNAELINPETGTPKDDSVVLAYENAVNANNKNYYKDYTVYIAGDGQSFSGRNLRVKLSANAGIAQVNKAISVDFYALNVTATGTTIFGQSNYRGTLNVANVENDGTTGTKAHTYFDIEGETIPQADGGHALAVLMRVYYDGALIETAGSTDYAQYKEVLGSDSVRTGGYYYTTDDHSVSVVATGSTNINEVVGLDAVDFTNSAVTYASSNEYGSVDDVVVKATFELQ